jgi:hypothetical protein
MKRHPKLKGQRLGQVVYNALYDGSEQEIAGKLFWIEDEDLVKLINDYLKEQ